MMALGLVFGSSCATPESSAPRSGLGSSASSVSSTTPTDLLPGRGACSLGPGVSTATIFSAALGRDLRVTIISAVPISDVRGVVYLLHGAGTDETQWAAIGTQIALDGLPATVSNRSVAVVLPDLPSAYDVALDSVALIGDVVPSVEACLSRPLDRSNRAVGGISRGGQLALAVAAEHPNLFGAVGGHSPVVPGDQTDALARELATSGLRVWLDVGTHDALRPTAVGLANRLAELGAPAELHVWPGQHDRAYWSAHVRDYLNWYAQQIAR
jgi:S-formylglutathione hydrolase FrmB